jgi:hypothetical protein
MVRRLGWIENNKYLTKLVREQKEEFVSFSIPFITPRSATTEDNKTFSLDSWHPKILPPYPYKNRAKMNAKE